MAEIEAVLKHRRTLVATRTLFLQHVQEQISKLPTKTRDQLSATGRIESRLRRVAATDTDTAITPVGRHRICWLQDVIDQDKVARRQIRDDPGRRGSVQGPERMYLSATHSRPRNH